MLDQHHRNAAGFADIENKASQIFLFFGIHARHRLVHQQDLRLLRKGTTEIDSLTLAIAERADRTVADRLHLEQFDDFLHHLRSEEHTSELQSLMRISYAVFCLKTKKQ